MEFTAATMEVIETDDFEIRISRLEAAGEVPPDEPRPAGDNDALCAPGMIARHVIWSQGAPNASLSGSDVEYTAASSHSVRSPMKPGHA
jgi:hypothetical protein